MDGINQHIAQGGFLKHKEFLMTGSHPDPFDIADIFTISKRIGLRLSHSI